MHERIQQLLEQLLTALELPFSAVRVQDDGDMIRVDIDSAQASRIIGWHGETLNAIQHLTKSIIRSEKQLEKAPFIIVDVDGYRRAQEEKVCHIAEQKIDFVRSKKTRVALSPMSPYLRRIVHLFIASTPEYADIATESVGEGNYRQIVLRLKEGNMDDGEELSPVIEKEEEQQPKETGDGFENLDV